MLNIVMPIAGAGQRFKAAGYTDPKPLIKIDGQPMWEMVAENVRSKRYEHEFIVITQGDVLGFSVVDQHISHLISLSGTTEGAASTMLEAEKDLDNYDPLLIVNGDQYIEGLDIDAFLDFAKDYHGCIMTFEVGPDDPPKWSYVGHSGEFLSTNMEHRVWRVAEKDPISNEATCGLYWFRHGRDFLRAAHAMITKDIRTNGEYYLCPVYNEMIADGLMVGAWKVEDHGAIMYGLGTPEDLEKFLAHRHIAGRPDSHVA